jgi:hypothetical protein
MARVGCRRSDRRAELAGLAVAIGATLGIGSPRSPRAMARARRRWVERAWSSSPIAAHRVRARAHVRPRRAARVVPLPGDPEAGVSGSSSRARSCRFRSPHRSGAWGAPRSRARAGAVPHRRRREGSHAGSASGFLHALPVASGPIVTVIADAARRTPRGRGRARAPVRASGAGHAHPRGYASRDLPVLEGGVVAAGATLRLAPGPAAVVHARSTRGCGREADRSGSMPLGLVGGSRAGRGASPGARARPTARATRSRGAPRRARPLGCGEAGVDLLALVAHAELRGSRARPVVAHRRLSLRDAARRVRGAGAWPLRARRSPAPAISSRRSRRSFSRSRSSRRCVRRAACTWAAVFALTAWAPFARLALVQTRVLRDSRSSRPPRALGDPDGSRARAARAAERARRRRRSARLGGARSSSARPRWGSSASGRVTGCRSATVLDQGVAAMLRAPHVLVVGAACGVRDERIDAHRGESRRR